VRTLALALVVLTSIAVAGPAAAVRACKDGYVTYVGSLPSPTRTLAEASAVRAWRIAVDPSRVRGMSANPRPGSVRCVSSSAPRQWRCFVRAGRCTRG
jgi:hypothetical protein